MIGHSNARLYDRKKGTATIAAVPLFQYV